jgi:hypothetical protein
MEMDGKTVISFSRVAMIGEKRKRERETWRRVSFPIVTPPLCASAAAV